MIPTLIYLKNNTKSLYPLWLKFVSICVISWLKNKPKSQVALTIVLTNNYQDQRIPGQKTKPICCSKTLFLNEKSMIPNYKNYAKRTQLEN